MSAITSTQCHGLHGAKQFVSDNYTPAPITELDAGLTDDQRRIVTPDLQQAFRDSIASPLRHFDEIDLEIDEYLQLDPYAGDPPSKKSDKEINRVLSILDELEERGNG